MLSIRLSIYLSIYLCVCVRVVCVCGCVCGCVCVCFFSDAPFLVQKFARTATQLYELALPEGLEWDVTACIGAQKL